MDVIAEIIKAPFLCIGWIIVGAVAGIIANSIMHSNQPLLTDVILPLVPSISDASIKLNALDITHVFQSPDEICATLQAHYTSNFLFQLYKIIGSVDIIGNPLSFASSLGTGVIDFFYEPAQGLIKVRGGWMGLCVREWSRRK